MRFSPCLALCCESRILNSAIVAVENLPRIDATQRSLEQSSFLMLMSPKDDVYLRCCQSIESTLCSNYAGPEEALKVSRSLDL